MAATLKAREDDPRVAVLLFLMGKLGDYRKLRLAAEMGYVPAQAKWGSYCEDPAESLVFSRMAAAQGNREAMFHLALLLRGGGPARRTKRGCSLC